MNVISFVMGTEVHKQSIVSIIREMLPEDTVKVYKSAFIDDLFQASEESHVVILDLEANISLREVTRHYKYSDTKIAIILPDTDLKFIEEYFPYQLAGYFTVHMDVHEFVDGIRYMMQGVTYFQPLLAEVLYKNYKQLLYKKENRPAKLLTKREWEVLGELVQGYQNEEIAKNLDISDKTVKNHITSILRKLGVKDRTKAVLMALRERWYYL